MSNSVRTMNRRALGAALTVILLATTSAFLARMTLESERPPPTGQGVSTAVIQDRDARLWQDPFGVAGKKTESPSCYEIEAGSATRTLSLLLAS